MANEEPNAIIKGAQNNAGKFRSLASNTLVFTVGNALVKLIQLLLLPLYTSYMATSDYGVAELVNNLSDFLYPLFCLAIYESVFRFLMEKDAPKEELLGGGLLVLLVTIPVGALVSGVAFAFFSYDQAWGCYVLVLAVSVRMLLAQFARGSGEVVRFAVSGVLNALFLLLFDVVFLVLFDGGVNGYVLALVLGNCCSACYLFVSCKIWRCLGKLPNRGLLMRMLAYSLPMLPNQLAWWFLNIFGRYVILAFQGSVAAGVYTAASKFPSLVNFMSSIFRQAWQISAAKEMDGENDGSYFSKVFGLFLSFVVCGSSLVIALTEPLARLLLKGDFYEGWHIVPILMLAALIGCISVFFEAFYTAAERTGALFVSSVAGAAVNVVLALCLGGSLGIWGVPLATLAGQVTNALVRMVDSRRFMRLDYEVALQAALIAAVIVQVVLVSILPASAGLVAGLLLFAIEVCLTWRRYGTVARRVLMTLLETYTAKLK